MLPLPRSTRFRFLRLLGVFAVVALRLSATDSMSSKHETAEAPLVHVTGGQIRGQRLEANTGAVFRGIPFASPPVGDLRWREPQPVKPWDGVRDAYAPGPPASQFSQGWNKEFAAKSSEDCLYLDVWTPDLHPAHKNPVMVWIHGGANVAGAGGADPLYESRSLIAHGVVVVVIEYRLGVFGFLAHPDLSAESPHHVSGNYAILDQLAALHWVQENITRFGGDPENVTVFGQSAGAMDISALLVSPLARGLFHRAIAESGAMVSARPPSLKEAEKRGRVLEAALHLGAEGKSALDGLRHASTAELLSAGSEFRDITIDGWVFLHTPGVVFRDGHSIPVPLLIGSNSVEFPIDGGKEQISNVVSATFGETAPQALELYGLVANETKTSDPIFGDFADQVGSDVVFRLPSIIQGDWQTRAGHSTWQYLFARAIPPRAKPMHSGELSYVFGNLLPTGSQPGEFTEKDRALSKTVQAYWTNFAKTGNPNGDGLPTWPEYQPKTRTFLEFTAEGGVTTVRDLRSNFVELFRKALEAQLGAKE